MNHHQSLPPSEASQLSSPTDSQVIFASPFYAPSCEIMNIHQPLENSSLKNIQNSSLKDKWGSITTMLFTREFQKQQQFNRFSEISSHQTLYEPSQQMILDIHPFQNSKLSTIQNIESKVEKEIEIKTNLKDTSILQCKQETNIHQDNLFAFQPLQNLLETAIKNALNNYTSSNDSQICYNVSNQTVDTQKQQHSTKLTPRKSLNSSKKATNSNSQTPERSNSFKSQQKIMPQKQSQLPNRPEKVILQRRAALVERKNSPAFGKNRTNEKYNNYSSRKSVNKNIYEREASQDRLNTKCSQNNSRSPPAQVSSAFTQGYLQRHQKIQSDQHQSKGTSPNQINQNLNKNREQNVNHFQNSSTISSEITSTLPVDYRLHNTFNNLNSKNIYNKELMNVVKNQDVRAFLIKNFVVGEASMKLICSNWQSIPLTYFIKLVSEEVPEVMHDKNIGEQLTCELKQQISLILQNPTSPDKLCLERLNYYTQATGLLGIILSALKQLHPEEQIKENYEVEHQHNKQNDLVHQKIESLLLIKKQKENNETVLPILTPKIINQQEGINEHHLKNQSLVVKDQKHFEIKQQDLIHITNLIQEFCESLFIKMEHQIYSKFEVEMRRLTLKYKETEKLLRIVSSTITDNYDVIATRSNQIKKIKELEREKDNILNSLRYKETEIDKLNSRIDLLLQMNEQLKFQNQQIEERCSNYYKVGLHSLHNLCDRENFSKELEEQRKLFKENLKVVCLKGNEIAFKDFSDKDENDKKGIRQLKKWGETERIDYANYNQLQKQEFTNENGQMQLKSDLSLNTASNEGEKKEKNEQSLPQQMNPQ